MIGSSDGFLFFFGRIVADASDGNIVIVINHENNNKIHLYLYLSKQGDLLLVSL